jgi:tagatose 6-phosphate kinase
MAFAHLTLDAVNRAVDVRQTASGKSINVARVLHTLGQGVLATGFLGGEGGRYIAGELDRLGAAHDFITVDAPTRTCITVLDRGGKTVTELVEETQRLPAVAYDHLLELVRRNLWRVNAVVFSGSLTPGAPQDFYAGCTRLARGAGIPIILDARGEPLRLALAEEPTIVKPNKSELQETVGFVIDSADRLKQAMSQMLSLGAGSVVVTMGADGAMASDGHASYWVHAPRVTAVNPIGSGDAFAAGLAAGLIEGKSFPECCRLGAACGAANALTATSGEVCGEDVTRLVEQVKVEEA